MAMASNGNMRSNVIRCEIGRKNGTRSGYVRDKSLLIDWMVGWYGRDGKKEREREGEGVSMGMEVMVSLTRNQNRHTPHRF